MSPEALEAMLAVTAHRSKDGLATFFESADGVALACGHTATFGHEPDVLPWHEDSRVVAAISGTVWPQGSPNWPSAAAGHDLRLLLKAFSQAPRTFAEELDGDFSLFL